jgi:hypothetical protein
MINVVYCLDFGINTQQGAVYNGFLCNIVLYSNLFLLLLCILMCAPFFIPREAFASCREYFNSMSLRSSLRTASTRLAAGIANAGKAAEHIPIFLQTSHKVAVSVTISHRENEGRIVLARGVARRQVLRRGMRRSKRWA